MTITPEGLPLGVTTSPATPFSIAAGSSHQMTFSAPAAAGTFPLNILGTGGGLSNVAGFTLTVTPQPNPFLVSASYYPWYFPGTWDYVDCAYGSLRENLVPPEPPALGEYNSQSETTISQQIAWSVAAGINVWDMEWVGPNNSLDSTLQDDILTNPHIGDIRFAIFYDYSIRFGGDLNVTPDKITTILSDFTYMAQTYFNHPSYLKVEGGRPVVFIYTTWDMTPISAVQSMASAIRSAMSQLGYNVYLIGDEYIASIPPDPVRISNWDGIFGYNTYIGIGGYSDQSGFLALHQTMESQYQAVAQQYGVDFVPSVSPGFNDRAVRRVCANNPALARRTSAGAAEGSMFNDFFGNIAIPLATNSKTKMIHITSFNEWHEDTQIEPTVVTPSTTQDTSPLEDEYTQDLIYQGYGTTYLDIIRNQIAAAVAQSQQTHAERAAAGWRPRRPFQNVSADRAIPGSRPPWGLGLQWIQNSQGACFGP